MSNSSTRLAVDIGGTFTDVALAVGDRNVTSKVLTTAAVPEQGVMKGIALVIEAAGVNAGDIGVVAKLKDTHTGDTLCKLGRSTRLAGIEWPRQDSSIAIYAAAAINVSPYPFAAGRPGAMVQIDCRGAPMVRFLLQEEVEAWEGGVLLFGMLVALYILVRWSLTDADSDLRVEREVREVIDGRKRPLIVEILLGLAALAVTVFSADLLLDGALDLGIDLGLSDTFLGVMLGVGTSLPELATSLASIRRNESDLVIGNVLGSNLFNSLAVAGTAAVVGSGPLDDLGVAALWTMVGVAVLAGVMSKTGQEISRREGVALLAVFAVFVVVAY